MPTKRVNPNTGYTTHQIGIRLPDSIYKQVAKTQGSSTNAKVLNLLKSALKQQKTA